MLFHWMLVSFPILSEHFVSGISAIGEATTFFLSVSVQQAYLRRFSLKFRAINAKIIYQKSTQRKVTFCMLFETSYCNSFL